MKYLGLSFLTLLLALSLEASAQVNPFSAGVQGLGTEVQLVPNQDMCPDYKITIVTPLGDIDFKMQVITPSKNIDEGIVLRLCSPSNQLSLAPQFTTPPRQANPFFNGTILTDPSNGFMSGQGNPFRPGKIK